MTYTLRFFTHHDNSEQLIEEYKFDTLPYIPHKHDIIGFNNDSYKVVGVATDYLDAHEQLFEIMMDDIDYNKEWWE